MRPIKFRAWDKVNKEWLKTKSGGLSLNNKTQKLEYTFSDTFTLHDWETCRKIGAFPGNYEVVQFTGLNDKNEKEVYEGDCVTMHQFLFDGNEVESRLFGVITYLEDSTYFEDVAAYGFKKIRNKFYENHTGFEPGEGVSPLCYFYGLHEESFEIIGNIYENPDLLEEE